MVRFTLILLQIIRSYYFYTRKCSHFVITISITSNKNYYELEIDFDFNFLKFKSIEQMIPFCNIKNNEVLPGQKD